MMIPKPKVFTITTVSGKAVTYHGTSYSFDDTWFKVEQDMMRVALHKVSDILSIEIVVVEPTD